MAASAGAKTGGSNDHSLIAGDIAHGDESEDCCADGKEAGNGKYRTLSRTAQEHTERFVRVVALEEIYSYDDLVADENECVEITQADLADTVFERE